MAATNGCKLLALPVELRLRIYNSVISASLRMDMHNSMKKDKYNLIALLCTCRKIQTEATPEFTAVLGNELVAAHRRVSETPTLPDLNQLNGIFKSLNVSMPHIIATALRGSMDRYLEDLQKKAHFEDLLSILRGDEEEMLDSFDGRD
jgi:hypothetical protein